MIRLWYEVFVHNDVSFLSCLIKLLLPKCFYINLIRFDASLLYQRFCLLVLIMGILLFFS